MANLSFKGGVFPDLTSKVNVSFPYTTPYAGYISFNVNKNWGGNYGYITLDGEPWMGITSNAGSQGTTTNFQFSCVVDSGVVINKVGNINSAVYYKLK